MHAPSRSYWQQQKKKNKQVNREFAARPHCHKANNDKCSENETSNKKRKGIKV